MAVSEVSALRDVSREEIYRRNFVYFMADSVLFRLAMAIMGATTVVPDFVRRLTNSEILIGLSGNLFTVGCMLPQLFVARYIVRHVRKKRWFVGPNVPIRFTMLLFSGIALWLGQDRPGLVLAAFFICYGIAGLGDGLVGVPWADLIATSLDHRWRARLLGLATVVAGVAMLGLAPLIGRVLGASGPGFPSNYALVFGAAGLVLAFSILPGLFVQELPGGKAQETVPSLAEFLPELGRVLRHDRPFRAYVLARMFTNLCVMAFPFYIGYATLQLGLSSEVAVPVLLAMQTVGSLGGAVAYTWLGARNNVLYIRLALVGAALLPVSALLAGVVGPVPLYAGFFVSGLATMNLPLAYLNWVVSYADPDRRPVYVGLANTVAAVSSLLAPLIGGTIAQYLGYRPLFAVALIMALCALFVTLRFLRDREQAGGVGRLEAPLRQAETG